MPLSFNQTLIDQVQETAEEVGVDNFFIQKIEKMIADGMSPEQIDAYLVRAYGLPRDFRTKHLEFTPS